MRVVIKVYSDSDELLQTITTAAEEISLDAKWEQPERWGDPWAPIVRPENHIETLALVMKKLIKEEDDTVYKIESTPLGQTTITPL